MLKLYTIKKKIVFSSEQIILFGLLDKLKKEPIHCYNFKNESRYNGIINFCKKHYLYVDDPRKCDVMILPYKFVGINDKIFTIMSRLSKNLNKELWCFYNDDNDSKFHIESHIKLYRTSFYSNTKLKNEFPLIAFSPDYYNNNIIFEKKLSIGYCGHVMHGRNKYLNILTNSNIKTNFIIRNGFWAPGIDKMKARYEYFNNIEKNIFTFCYRGAGNFSYRFYETLMMGRIPIFIDTNCVIPNFEILLSNNACVYIKEKDITSPEYIISKINTYFIDNSNSLIQIQKNNRKLWETYYSPIGFLNNLI